MTTYLILMWSYTHYIHTPKLFKLESRIAHPYRDHFYQIFVRSLKDWYTTICIPTATWRNSGYKALDSAVNQIIYITHKIYQSLERGEDVCMISLDATAAFDCVWPKGLLYKLKQIGICGNLLKLHTWYLSHRQQRVVINGKTSARTQNTCRGTSRIDIRAANVLDLCKWCIWSLWLLEALIVAIYRKSWDEYTIDFFPVLCHVIVKSLESSSKDCSGHSIDF